MENIDKKIEMLDRLIDENQKKIEGYSSNANTLSSKINYIILEQKSFIDHILLDNKFKDGLNLTFMKKMYALLKKVSFVTFLILFVAFFFNASIPFALLVALIGIFSRYCKNKNIEYADMISQYEAAFKQSFSDNCTIDLARVKEKQKEVDERIISLKVEHELLNEQILVTNDIIDKIFKNKNELITSMNCDNNSVLDIEKDNSIDNDKVFVKKY